MTYIPYIDDDRIPPVSWMPLIMIIMTFPDVAEEDLMSLYRKCSAMYMDIASGSGMDSSVEKYFVEMINNDNSMILAMLRAAAEEKINIDDMRSRFAEGKLAGDILYNVMRLDHYDGKGAGSVAKSVHIIEYSQGISRSKLMRAWKTYKNVSNYYVALKILIEFGVYDPEERLINARSLGLDESMASFAIHSLFFQAFINISMHINKAACERVDRVSKTRLQDLKKSWTVKKEFIEKSREHCKALGFTDDQILQINTAPSVPFTQKEAEALSKYKATIR